MPVLNKAYLGGQQLRVYLGSTLLMGLAPTTTNGYVLDGDSITNGYGVTPTYPTQLATNTGLTTQNLGVSGRALQEMRNTFGSRGVGALFNATNRNTLVILGGINDIMNTAGMTAATLQTLITEYCAFARAAGFRVFVGTIGPVSGLEAAKETMRTTHNAWLRANFAGISNGLVDFAQLSELTNPANATYYTDGLHLTAAGYGVMAEAVRVATGVAAVVADQQIFRDDFAANINGYTVYAFTQAYSRSVQPARASALNGNMRITSLNNSIYPHVVKDMTGLTVGHTYRVEVELVATNRYGFGVDVMSTSNLDGATVVSSSDNPVGLRTFTFTATATNHLLKITAGADGDGFYNDINYVRLVKPAA